MINKFSKKEEGDTMKKSQRSLVIIVMIFVLLITAISLATIAIISSSKSTSKNSVSDAKLSVEWSAVQADNESSAYVTANLYLEYRSASVGSIDNNTLIINGNKHTFSSSSINENKSEMQKKLLTTYTTKIDRVMGTSVSCPIEATWLLNGTSDGEKAKELSVNISIDLNDNSISITKGTEPVTDEVTEPITIPPAPVTDPITDIIPSDTTSDTTSIITPDTTTPADTTTSSGVIEPVDPDKVGAFSKDVTLTSSTPTSLKLRAECHAESKGDGKATIKVELYFDYQTLFLGARKGCVLKVGDKTVKFDLSTIEEDDPALHKVYLTSTEVTVAAGSTVSVYASIPYNGTYSGQYITDMVVSGNIDMK